MNELSERVIEDLVALFPEDLLGEPLVLVKRQMELRNRRFDLLFRDQAGQNVIVEIKRGEITREALGQLGEYLGILRLEWKDQKFRFMVLGTHIPPERKSYFEAIGCEAWVVSTTMLLEFAEQKGIDPRVGIVRAAEERRSDPDRSHPQPLAVLGVSDEASFLEHLRAQPDTISSDRVVAVYSMLKSFPECTWRFEAQGRSIFTLRASGVEADIAYVGLNRKYGSRELGQYGFEVVVRWRNIATTWGDEVTRPFRDILMQIAKPTQVRDILSEAKNKGVYVGINVATDLPGERFRVFLTGLRDFLDRVISSKYQFLGAGGKRTKREFGPGQESHA